MKKLPALLAAAALLTGCAGNTSSSSDQEKTTSSVVQQSPADTPESDQQTEEYPPVETLSVSLPDAESSEAAEEPVSVTLICAGDNLIHSPIYKQASRRAGGSGYDFLPAYEKTADLIASADLAILNQETVVTDEFEPSNYPLFASPEALGDDMVKMGFDAVSICNNHVLDKGERGLRSTINYWRDKHPEILLYGASFKGENDIPVMEVNGIKFAFLGYMEHTNGISLPSDTECEITYLREKDKIKEQVKAAASTADCVIVSVHYGVEVSGVVTDDQLQATRELADWGADIIIGTQPHTVQPMEFVEKADGGRAFVFYCLGNYISAMDNPLAMVGMLGRLTVTKYPSTGKIVLSDPDPVPVITHYGGNYSNIEVYPWDEYTKDLAAAHGCPGFSYSFAEDLVENQIKIVDYLD